MMSKKIAIIMGSKSDNDHLEKLYKVLQDFQVPFEALIVSAHRTPHWMYQFAKTASKKYEVIIACAGGSAHLPGMVASLTDLPVIGVPIFTKNLKGVDSLLSIIQMPEGSPVATVGINSVVNAGLLAIKILALKDAKLRKKIVVYKTKIATEIERTCKLK